MIISTQRHFQKHSETRRFVLIFPNFQLSVEPTGRWLNPTGPRWRLSAEGDRCSFICGELWSNILDLTIVCFVLWELRYYRLKQKTGYLFFSLVLRKLTRIIRPYCSVCGKLVICGLNAIYKGNQDAQPRDVKGRSWCFKECKNL